MKSKRKIKRDALFEKWWKRSRIEGSRLKRGPETKTEARRWFNYGKRAERAMADQMIAAKESVK